MEDHTPKHGELKLAVKDDHDLVDLVQRAQWLRAAILGANDGLLSTAALMIGMGAAREDRWSMILSGLAGAVAGACSMAVGEFVSVATQRDIEEMGLLKSPPKPSPLCDQPAASPNTNVISTPGKSPMMRVISEDEARSGVVKGGDVVERALPSPLRAAVASALAFLCGSGVPLVSGMFVGDYKIRTYVIVMVASLALVVFGGVGAYLGGSRVKVSSARLLVGGWVSMAITYGLLKSFDDDDHD